jgi:cytoskeletal protein CcmA (bactofilin family)
MSEQNNSHGAAAHHTTVIGPDTTIKGEMSFEGAARILGNFEGKISSKGELHIADGAVCKASVDAAKVTIDGTVEGNVSARERVELTAKAKMKGDLMTAKLLVAEGAIFSGHISVGPEAANRAAAGKPAEVMAETKPITVQRVEYARR